MGRLLLFVLLFLVCAFRSFGQSLQFAPASGSAGSNIAIPISLKSPEGKEPSTLQWQTTIPLAKVGQFEETSPGPAAKTAGKAINCAVKSKTAETYSTMCIVYGGQGPVGNGVIAILNLKIAPEAPAGSFRIRVDEALAVYSDMRRVPIEPTETTVTVK